MARWSAGTASFKELVAELSWPALVLLAFAIFFLFSTTGFLIDIMGGGRQPGPMLATNVAFSGGIALLYAYGGLRRKGWPIVTAIAMHIVFANQAPRLFAGMPSLPASQTAARLTFDAAATLAAVVASYTCFLWFINTTAARYLRIRTEIELAREIHRVLVPRLSTTIGDYEFFGSSAASGEVGGDLVDVVAVRGGWLGYVADVSGHGVSSGVVMGMFKSALRVRLLSGGALGAALGDVNSTMVPLMSPSMFVTVAAVKHEANHALEFLVAGHLPILKIAAGTAAAQEISHPQLPIGFFADTVFVASPMTCEPGDLLAIVTDGLTEVFNRRDDQFGLDRVKDVLVRHAARPLPEIADALAAAAAAFGKQLDDQTLLLIRRAPPPGSAPNA